MGNLPGRKRNIRKRSGLRQSIQIQYTAKYGTGRENKKETGTKICFRYHEIVTENPSVPEIGVTQNDSRKNETLRKK